MPNSPKKPFLTPAASSRRRGRSLPFRGASLPVQPLPAGGDLVGDRTLLLANPNHFGNLAGSPYPAVLKIAGNKFYEEIGSVGFQPQFDRLEALVYRRQPSGYRRGVDAAGVPIDDLSTFEAREEAFTMLRKAKHRRVQTVPAVREFEIIDVQPAPEVPADLKAAPANARALKSGTRYVVLKRGTETAKARSFDKVTYHSTSWDSEGRQVESSEVLKRPAASTAPFRLPRALEETFYPAMEDRKRGGFF